MIALERVPSIDATPPHREVVPSALASVKRRACLRSCAALRTNRSARTVNATNSAAIGFEIYRKEETLISGVALRNRAVSVTALPFRRQFWAASRHFSMRKQCPIYPRQTECPLTVTTDIGQLSRKKRDRLAAVSPKSNRCFDQAANAAAFRFLRQPTRPNAPRPLAKSGRAAGRGVSEALPPVRISPLPTLNL